MWCCFTLVGMCFFSSYWYETACSTHVDVLVELQDVCQYMAVGVTTQYIPNGPKLPPGGEVVNLIAVPKTRSKKAEFVWILCSDQNELK